MVTRNPEGTRGKDVVIIIRVGRIITNKRMKIIMINQIIMLVREIKKRGR
jgi:hypothetical protein